jgi:hypothetical protein
MCCLVYVRSISAPRRLARETDSVAGVGGLELGNVGFIECAPNALVCQNILARETFRGGGVAP